MGSGHAETSTSQEVIARRTAGPLQHPQGTARRRAHASLPGDLDLPRADLLRHGAPPLPLAGCNMRKTCQCKYIKHRDRRSEPRRLIDFGVVARLFDGNERRARRAGRRTSD